MTSGTEAPSERRLREARRSGYVPFSRTLCRGATLAAALATLPLVAERLVGGSIRWWHDVLQPAAKLPENLAEKSAEFAFDALGPVLYAGFVAVSVVGFVQTGGVLRGRAASDSPQPSSRGPSVGRRSLGLAGGLIALTGALALAVHHLPSAANTLSQPDVGLGFFGALGKNFLELAVGVTVAFGVTDWFLARHDWYESLKMTPREKQDEFRREYGAPEIRAARQAARDDARTVP